MAVKGLHGTPRARWICCVINDTKAEGPAKGQPMLNTAIDAAEMILDMHSQVNRPGSESLGCPVSVAATQTHWR